jgi:transposase
MPVVKKITVKESISELKGFCKGESFTVQKRIQMLVFIKNDTKGFVSKRKLSSILGVNHTSITIWKKIYETAGIEGLLKDGRIGFKPSLVSAENHQKIAEKLSNPTNNINGYKELQEWVKTELFQDLKYITVLKYVQRHFGTKIKVCRKSHIKKDEGAVENFKKNLEPNVLS